MIKSLIVILAELTRSLPDFKVGPSARFQTLNLVLVYRRSNRRHSEGFISKLSGAAGGLEFTPTLRERAESIQRLTPPAPVRAGTRRQPAGLIKCDFAAPAHKSQPWLITAAAAAAPKTSPSKAGGPVQTPPRDPEAQSFCPSRLSAKGFGSERRR